jgi:hypothetical protein
MNSTESVEQIRPADLVGSDILIVETGEYCGNPTAYVRFENAGPLFWFYTGVVVAEQLRNVRLPVWAVMRLVEGSKHPYYTLTLAELARTTLTQDSIYHAPFGAKFKKLSGGDALQPLKDNLCKQQKPAS